jgi:hypothetical protein
MSKAYRYDVYNITVPGDLFNDDDPQVVVRQILDQAIYEARESANTFISPCQWTAKIVSPPDAFDYEVRVVRKSRRPEKTKLPNKPR